jgi:hypothetical protein
MTRSLLDTMRRAMLPLDGSIAEHVPAILAAYANILPERDWHRLTMVDLTAGSCLMPLLFAARGVRRVVINDAAARTRLAAAALFGGRRLDPARVRQLIAAPAPRLRPHVPTFHFASDYLTSEAADVFDRLFYAVVPAAERAVYQYLALRWVLGFALSDDDDFELLPTQDYDLLAKDDLHDWRPYIRRVRGCQRVLARLVEDINAGIDGLTTRTAAVYGDDLRAVCRQIVYRLPCFVAINPPTRGLDEYVIDDQLSHSVLANRWLPLSRSRETAEGFWTSCVETALRALPRGAHALVWGGDGTMRWRDCWEVWMRHADPRAVGRVRSTGPKCGWAIVEKR